MCCVARKQPVNLTFSARTSVAVHDQRMSDIIGFVGLGAIGYPMARNMSMFLKSTGRQLCAYNRTASKVRDLAADPAAAVEPVGSLVELSRQCDVIFTMLADDDAVKAVMGQLLASGGRASVLVDCSTVLPETTQTLAERAAEVGASYVAACVFGRPDAAAASRLIVVGAGPHKAKQRILPYLTALCTKYIDLGESAQKANVMKLCGNFTIVSVIEMVSEAMVLAEKNGVSREVVLDFLSTFYPSPAIQGYSSRIAADNFVAGQGFTVELGLKDVRHMRTIAEKSSTPLPLADLAFQHLLQARAIGHGQSDWGAIALAVRSSAGLAIPPGNGNSASSSGTMQAGVGSTGSLTGLATARIKTSTGPGSSPSSQSGSPRTVRRP